MTATRPPAGYPAPRAAVADLPTVPAGPAPGARPASKGFRVTVEDLDTGERQAMVVAEGDYFLAAFPPCYRAGVQAYPTRGTQVITIKGHRPAAKPRQVKPEPVPPDEVAEAEARGYARAVAVLRDDERYERWWTRMRPDHPEYGYWNVGRKHLADYLETIDKPLPTAQPTPATVSSVIAVSDRFTRAAAGHDGGRDWVRLRTGSGRTYEGYRSPTCPGDGQPGHRHDIRCVTSEERSTTS